MKDRTLVFDTADVRDVAALALAYRNWLEAPHVVARDAVRSMWTSAGGVPLPFHGPDGDWATRVDPEGTEQIANPVECWGVLYEAHRERWLRALLGAPLRSPDADYLAAAGFEPKNPHDRYASDYLLKSRPLQDCPDMRDVWSRGLLEFHLDVLTSSDGGSEYAIRVEFPAEGLWHVDRRYLDFVSSDVRDILALVVAAENWWFEREGARALPEQRLGTVPGTARDIPNFFGRPGADREWNGRTIHGRTDLHHPHETWGHVFVAWRDRWAELVLSAGDPVPCGTFSSTKCLYHPIFESDMSAVVGTGSGVCIYDGGEEQPVALLRSRGYPDLLPIGLRIVEDRLRTMPAERRRDAGVEREVLAAITCARSTHAPAPGA
ncbi:hypothetical protein [Methylobacterium hispanicum]|nr:hypothetical protein [Methylobacterium hispanicum]